MQYVSSLLYWLVLATPEMSRAVLNLLTQSYSKHNIMPVLVAAHVLLQISYLTSKIAYECASEIGMHQITTKSK